MVLMGEEVSPTEQSPKVETWPVKQSFLKALEGAEVDDWLPIESSGEELE